MEVRKTTERLLEMIEGGTLSKDILIMACLKWMSEDDVEAMAKANEFLEDKSEDDE